MVKRPTEEYPDAEAEKRANAAIFRALTTPYKPQREMIGKTGRSSLKKRKVAKTSRPRKP